MNRKLLLLTGVIGLFLLLFALDNGAGRTPKAFADDFSANFDIVLCDGKGGANDAVCAAPDATANVIADNDGIPEVGEKVEVRTYFVTGFAAGAEEATFGLANTIWTGGLAAGAGAPLPDGEEVAEISFSIESNLVNPLNANVDPFTGQPSVLTKNAATLSSTFKLYDGDLATSPTVSNQDTDRSGLNQEFENYFEATPPQTTINNGAGITAVQATPFALTVASTAGFSTPTDLWIDDERFTATVTNATTFQVTARNVRNTTAAAHADGAIVLGLSAACSGGAASGCASGGASGSKMDGVDLMPSALTVYTLPQIGLGNPLSRSFGKAIVSAGLGVESTVNFLVFDQKANPDIGGILTATVLNYPGVPSTAPSEANIVDQTVVTGPLFSVTVRIYGKSSPGNIPVRTVDTAGVNAYFMQLSSADNYDGDTAANEFDTCRDVVSVDTDVKPLHTDPDSDRWDSGCDPVPANGNNAGGAARSDNIPGGLGVWLLDANHCNVAYVPPLHGTDVGNLGGWDCDQDVDGDGRLNANDNCPFVADCDVDNADGDGNGTCLVGDAGRYTGVDWQMDVDSDGLGDVCDPAPTIKGSGTGYSINAWPHGFPGQPAGYQSHDDRCTDSFSTFAPGAGGVPELRDVAPNGFCVSMGLDGKVGGGDDGAVPYIDSDNDGDPDWFDANNSGTYQVGELIDTDSDSDADTHTDACEAVKGTSDPLQAISTPAAPSVALDCDGGTLPDEAEEMWGRNLLNPADDTTPTPTITPTPLPTHTPTPSPTPTQITGCIDRDGDTGCNVSGDGDDDGCTAAMEGASAPEPKPGFYGGFSDSVWYDVFDVKAPVKADAAGANKPRNKVIDIADALSVLFYFGANKDGPENGNGVAYNTYKSIDTDGDTDNDIGSIHPIMEGLVFDRSAGPGMTAGPPNNFIDIADALIALKQFGLSCS